MDHKTKEELCDFYQRLFNTDETFAREEASLENDLEVLQVQLAHLRATREEATKLMKQLNLLLEGTKVDPPKTAHP